jgi:urease accessory protein
MRVVAIVLSVILSPAAWGHGVHPAESGFGGGLLHPMTGIDHVLAAAGMGLWLSSQRFTSLSTALYFCSLISGMVIAWWTRGMIADFEWMLAATLIITGLLLCKSPRLPQSWLAAVMAVIFSCHFYAHIHEMPSGLSTGGVLDYVGGLFAGTVLVIAVAAATGRHASAAWLRIAGVIIAATGVTAFGLA